jgi:hypothetical protein
METLSNKCLYIRTLHVLYNVKQFLTYFLQDLKTEYILGVFHGESTVLNDL